MASSGRRRFVAAVALAGGAIAGARAIGAETLVAQDRPSRGRARRAAPPEHELPVTANEDLMREHGAIGRLLVVWSELAQRLRGGGELGVEPLQRSVVLVQRFVHDYHERMEEEHVFPRLERAGRERPLVATLRAQHDAGRRITRELASALAGPPLAPTARVPMAARLDAFVRMYQAHAPHEDTVVFPAFQELAGREYGELGERFEQEEHRRLGEGGFHAILEEIAALESAVGVDDLARFTPR